MFNPTLLPARKFLERLDVYKNFVTWNITFHFTEKKAWQQIIP